MHDLCPSYSSFLKRLDRLDRLVKPLRRRALTVANLLANLLANL